MIGHHLEGDVLPAVNGTPRSGQCRAVEEPGGQCEVAVVEAGPVEVVAHPLRDPGGAELIVVVAAGIKDLPPRVGADPEPFRHQFLELSNICGVVNSDVGDSPLHCPTDAVRLAAAQSHQREAVLSAEHEEAAPLVTVVPVGVGHVRGGDQMPFQMKVLNRAHRPLPSAPLMAATPYYWRARTPDAMWPICGDLDAAARPHDLLHDLVN